MLDRRLNGELHGSDIDERQQCQGRRRRVRFGELHSSFQLERFSILQKPSCGTRGGYIIERIQPRSKRRCVGRRQLCGVRGGHQRHGREHIFGRVGHSRREPGHLLRGRSLLRFRSKGHGFQRLFPGEQCWASRWGSCDVGIFARARQRGDQVQPGAQRRRPRAHRFECRDREWSYLDGKQCLWCSSCLHQLQVQWWRYFYAGVVICGGARWLQNHWKQGGRARSWGVRYGLWIARLQLDLRGQRRE
mmetsp:Transcript_37515/g.99863  ORF Transcript_37515/g.99863 Transcript_37515/m.99863 type:complete len:247 (-) Transcript_37515:4044-4784(-)